MGHRRRRASSRGRDAVIGGVSREVPLTCWQPPDRLNQTSVRDGRLRVRMASRDQGGLGTVVELSQWRVTPWMVLLTVKG